jgi:membrane-associated phospholipid phosphatase
MLRVLLFALAAYGVSLAALLTCGVYPTLPWAFLPGLAILSLPAALTCALMLGVLPSVRRWPVPTLVQSVGLGLVGLIVMTLRDYTGLWIGLMAGAVVLTTKLRPPKRFRRVSVALVIMAIGHTTVWNMNYLAALTTRGRLVDPLLVWIDMTILRLSTYNGAFPLVRTPWIFSMFERAYMFLFTEILAVAALIAIVGSTRDLSHWFGRMFGAYLLGLVIFVLMPTVGPHIFLPGSFDSVSWGHTLTWRILSQIATEYSSVLNGRPLNGFGYFVAAPSLHVAVALLCQHRFSQWPWIFWAFLPVNFLVIASTVVLGYHYVVDVPTGMALAGAVILLSKNAVTPHLPLICEGSPRACTGGS